MGKGLKVNMNYVNCALLVVVLILVVVCCFKKHEEGFVDAVCYNWGGWGRRKTCRKYRCDSSIDPTPVTRKWRPCGESYCTKNIQLRDSDRRNRIYECSNADFYKMKDSDELRKAVKHWLSDESTAITKYGHISQWNTSNVTDMSNMFYNANEFNEDIGNWNTSAVTNMKRMFYGATNFNQDIERNWVQPKGEEEYNAWDTSKVTNMREMFYKAHNFNQDIGNWKIHNNSNIYSMFNLDYPVHLRPSKSTSSSRSRGR
jgi:surface protein